MDSGKGGIWLIMPGVHLMLQIPENQFQCKKWATLIQSKTVKTNSINNKLDILNMYYLLTQNGRNIAPRATKEFNVIL